MDTVTAFFFCQSVIRIVCIFCAVSKAVTDFYKPVVLIVFIISGSIVCFCIISGTVFLNGFYRGFSSIFIISILKGVTIYVRYGFYPAKGIIAVGYGSIFVCDVRDSSVCCNTLNYTYQKSTSNTKLFLELSFFLALNCPTYNHIIPKYIDLFKIFLYYLFVTKKRRRIQKPASHDSSSYISGYDYLRNI